MRLNLCTCSVDRIGCDFHEWVPGDLKTMTWTCVSSDEQCPIARRILTKMGFSADEVERRLPISTSHGAFLWLRNRYSTWVSLEPRVRTSIVWGQIVYPLVESSSNVRKRTEPGWTYLSCHTPVSVRQIFFLRKSHDVSRRQCKLWM